MSLIEIIYDTEKDPELHAFIMSRFRVNGPIIKAKWMRWEDLAPAEREDPMEIKP